MASDDADGVALAAALMPDVVVLVADAGLGTINSIRTAMEALEVLVETRDGLELVVVLNRFDGSDELHRRNLAWLEDHDSLFLVTSVEDLTAVMRGGSRPD
jgi:dethiobiotin synthetase